jgi:branched-chain amino acid transport system ATP-binding protein
MLAIKDVNAGYQKLQILKSVSLHVKKGEIVSILGANGAGKTTILRSITGGVKISTGQILFEDREITGLPSHVVAKLGIAHVPENRKLFKDLSVEDNLLLSGKSFHRSKAEMANKLHYVYELFPRLKERQKQISGTLSGGEQQMVAIGRGLMMNPKILILDEPSQGLAPQVVSEIFHVIKTLAKNNNLTVLLVEQNIYEALHISDRGYIIKNGQVILEGNADHLLNQPDIKQAYLH